MKYVDFKKFTDENGAQPVYLFEGEETYFRDGGAALLLKRFVSDKSLDYSAFDGAALKNDKSAFTAACASYPFLSEKRFVKISEWYPSEKDYEAYLKPIAENPSPAVIVAIFNSAKTKAGAARLSSKKGITVVDCAKSDEQTIVKWIYITLKRAGVASDGATCGRLAEYCIYDMSRIAKETEKLIAYCEATGNAALSDAIVDEIVYPDSQYKIYELSNALAARNAEKFERIAAELFTKGFDETSLLSSLNSYFRNLYETSRATGSEKEIAVALGMNEYAVKKTRRQASEMGREKVFSSYEYLYSALGKIKCGMLTPQAAFKEVKAKLLLSCGENV